MNLYNTIAGDLESMAQSGRIYGVVVGVVTKNNDDKDKDGRKGQGQVRVTFPWLNADEESAWARVATPFGGMFFLPEDKEEVLVVFEQGDITRPYIIGALWGGTALPPTADGNGREQKVLKTKSGHIIRLDDTGGKEKIEIIGKDGQDMIIIDAAKHTITLKSDKVSIQAKEVEVVSTETSKYEAKGEMTVKGKQVNINC